MSLTAAGLIEALGKVDPDARIVIRDVSPHLCQKAAYTAGVARVRPLLVEDGPAFAAVVLGAYGPPHRIEDD